MRRAKYEVSGTDGAGNAFTVRGELESGESFSSIVTEAQRQAYQSLTEGKTEYGRPGAGGCKGPYTLERILVEVGKA